LIAKGAGFKSITLIFNKDAIMPKLRNQKPGCQYVLIKTDPGNAKVGIIPLEPIKIKERFMQSLVKEP
ncbi:MAG: sulfopyruvate decarboxylase subunit beta, partial [Candidatus Hermodarchaeota archaeon]